VQTSRDNEVSQGLKSVLTLTRGSWPTTPFLMALIKVYHTKTTEIPTLGSGRRQPRTAALPDMVSLPSGRIFPSSVSSQRCGGLLR